METQPTNQEILEAINTFASHTEDRFQRIENDINGIKNEISGMKNEIGGMKNTMVTKEYLDDKFSDHKADLIDITRKENKKLVALTDKLVIHKVLPLNEACEILAMEPFPQKTT